MRLELIIIGLLVALLGCNSDPRCRRETALLRAEILDLEDKYFLTKAQRDEALSALHSQGKSEVASKIAARSPQVAIPQSTEIYYGETFYEDGSLATDSEGYLPGESYPPGSVLPYQSDLVLDDMQLPARSTETQFQEPGPLNQPAIAQPTPSANPTPSRPRGSIFDSAEELPQAQDPSQSNPGTTPGAEPDRPSTSSLGPTGRTQLAGSAFSNPVTEVVIDRTQSGLSVGADPTPSLTLLLKPRDARGQPRRMGGTLTVSLIDPSSTVPEQRIGIWKFLPEEVELFFTEPNSEPGIRLNLPLEDGLPQGKHVTALVRLQLADGRVLETTARIPTSSAAPKINIEQGEDDQLAEREDLKPTTPAQPVSGSRPVWRPVR